MSYQGVYDAGTSYSFAGGAALLLYGAALDAYKKATATRRPPGVAWRSPTNTPRRQRCLRPSSELARSPPSTMSPPLV